MIANGLRKYLLLITGWLAVTLGFIGIFLPVFPTTPFLLLAAWCFMRSSQRAHDWLIGHPQLGPFIQSWLNGEGITVKQRNTIYLFMWAGMIGSMLFIQRWWVTILLILTGLAVSLYLNYHTRIPTKK